MLSPDVEIVDVDPISWQNLFTILQPAKQQRELFILHDKGTVLRVCETEKKRRTDISGPITDARALAKSLLSDDDTLDRVFIYDVDSVRHLFVRIRSPEYDRMDLDEYRHMVRGLVYGEFSSGICVEPPLGDWYDTCYEGFQKMFSRLPSPSTLVVGIYDSGREFTSLLIQLERGKAARISTFDALVPDGHKERSEPDDVGSFLRLVERKFPPVSFAVFTNPPVASAVVSSADPLGVLGDAANSGAARIPVGAEVLQSP